MLAAVFPPKRLFPVVTGWPIFVTGLFCPKSFVPVVAGWFPVVGLEAGWFWFGCWNILLLVVAGVVGLFPKILLPPVDGWLPPNKGFAVIAGGFCPVVFPKTGVWFVTDWLPNIPPCWLGGFVGWFAPCENILFPALLFGLLNKPYIYVKKLPGPVGLLPVFPVLPKKDGLLPAFPENRLLDIVLKDIDFA